MCREEPQTPSLTPTRQAGTSLRSANRICPFALGIPVQRPSHGTGERSYPAHLSPTPASALGGFTWVPRQCRPGPRRLRTTLRREQQVPTSGVSPLLAHGSYAPGPSHPCCPYGLPRPHALQEPHAPRAPHLPVPSYLCWGVAYFSKYSWTF